MKPLLLLLLASAAIAQTAAIPSMPVPIPPRLIPAQSITITIPKCATGCTASFIVPAQTVPAQTLQTPSILAPVSLTGAKVSVNFTFNFSCAGPDMQHLTCKAVTQ